MFSETIDMTAQRMPSLSPVNFGGGAARALGVDFAQTLAIQNDYSPNLADLDGTYYPEQARARQNVSQGIYAASTVAPPPQTLATQSYRQSPMNLNAIKGFPVIFPTISTLGSVGGMLG